MKSVQLPDKLNDRLREAAERKHISMNSYILQALDEKLERDENKAGVGEAVRDAS